MRAAVSNLQLWMHEHEQLFVYRILFVILVCAVASLQTQQHAKQMLGKQSQGLIWEDLIWQKPVSIHYLWLSLCFETNKTNMFFLNGN